MVDGGDRGPIMCTPGLFPNSITMLDGDANGAEPSHVDDDCKSALCGSEASHGTKSTTSAGEIKARAAKKPVVNKKKKEKNAQKNNKKKKRLAPFCGCLLYTSPSPRD